MSTTKHTIVTEGLLPSTYKLGTTKPIIKSLVWLPVIMNTENVVPKDPQINMVVYWKELSGKINCFLHSPAAQKFSRDWKVNSRKKSLKVCYDKVFQAPNVRQTRLRSLPGTDHYCVIPPVKHVQRQLPSSAMWDSLKGLPSLKWSKLKVSGMAWQNASKLISAWQSSPLQVRYCYSKDWDDLGWRRQSQAGHSGGQERAREGNH